MKTRNINPALALTPLMALDGQSAVTGLSLTHRDLIKIRASQLNGCAYCIDLHTKEAKERGETDRRLYSLAVWKDTPFFSPEERALLALTEEVTLIQGRVSDETFAMAVELLGDKYVVEALLAMITINAWNRLAISVEMGPAKE